MLDDHKDKSPAKVFNHQVYTISPKHHLSAHMLKRNSTLHELENFFLSV